MTQSFFTASTFYTGPDLLDSTVTLATQRLGRPLPQAYVELLRIQNGGIPRRRCFRTPFATSWSPHHIEIGAIRGVGGTWGIDTPGPLCSDALIEEWGYPPIGIVFCAMPSGGHDAVMLDYSSAGTDPTVVYVDEDRVPRLLADSFAQFVDNLVDCSQAG